MSASHAYRRLLRSLSPASQRQALLHRGTANEGMAVECVVLPEGWELAPRVALPHTKIEVGWHTYHMLRVSAEWSSAPMEAEVQQSAFPEPEYYSFTHSVPCRRFMDNPHGRKKSKRKAKRKLVEERDFALLYVYVRLEDEPVESHYMNWWEEAGA